MLSRGEVDGRHFRGYPRPQIVFWFNEGGAAGFSLRLEIFKRRIISFGRFGLIDNRHLHIQSVARIARNFNASGSQSKRRGIGRIKEGAERYCPKNYEHYSVVQIILRHLMLVI